MTTGLGETQAADHPGGGHPGAVGAGAHPGTPAPGAHPQ
jgi:hypothetical protein